MLARALKLLMLASLAVAVPLALLVRERPGVAVSGGLAFAAAVAGPRVLALGGLRPTPGLELVWLLPFSLCWGLGEGWALFERIDWWDDLTHLSAGGSGYVLLRNWVRRRDCGSPLAASLVALLGALAIGTLWEMGEFAADQLLGTATQSGNADTMTDLLFDFGGALCAAAARRVAHALGHTHASARTAPRCRRRLYPPPARV